MLIEAQKSTVAVKLDMERKLQILRADEAALRLAQVGKQEGEMTLYQRASKNEYRASRAFRKLHRIPRSEEEKARYKANQGPLYADKVDLPIAQPID